ncbi:MAG TPA: ABC transporter permease [Terrimicrobiaceae bacterium]|nr:ABC transporter permease [Terrimicrobiaceae bacterium]
MKKELGITVLLIVLCIIVAVLNPRFLGASNLTNMARLIGMYGIFSIGVGLVIITAGIDLSLGSVFALQGVILAIMLREWNLAWPLAVLLVVVGVMLLGATHGWFIGYVRMQPFIVTLCGLLFYRGLARFIANDETKGFGSSGFELLRTLATGSIGPVPMPFVLLIIVGIITYVLLHHSVFGRYLYAVGRNEDAARYSGINSRLIIMSTYIVEMLLVALAGILIAFYTNSISPANHGATYELYAIAAAVLGGCSLRGGEGSIIGIIIGTALLQVLQNLVNLLGIPSSLNFAVMGAVIFLGVLVDSISGKRRQKQQALARAPAPTKPAPPTPSQAAK